MAAAEAQRILIDQIQKSQVMTVESIHFDKEKGTYEFRGKEGQTQGQQHQLPTLDVLTLPKLGKKGDAKYAPRKYNGLTNWLRDQLTGYRCSLEKLCELAKEEKGWEINPGTLRGRLGYVGAIQVDENIYTIKEKTVEEVEQHA